MKKSIYEQEMAANEEKRKADPTAGELLRN